MYLPAVVRTVVDILYSSCSRQKYLAFLLPDDQTEDYEESKKFHGLLVTLYADFSRDKLLPFLRSSDHYALAEAEEACKERHYVDEQVSANVTL